MAPERKTWTAITVCTGCFSLVIALTSSAAAEDLAADPLKSASVVVLAASADPESLLKNKAAFEQFHADLAKAKVIAASLTSYTAVLEMQEEVSGRLRPSSRIQIKVRHVPFSVYMHWTENGQEALFVNGRNDNRLLVKPTNGLASLKRIWRLDPDGRMAKQNCRYPITELGFEKLVDRIQVFYALRNDWASVAECRVTEAHVAENDVTAYSVRFHDIAVSPDYVDSRFCFERKTGLLIGVDNFGWSDSPEPRLIEHYSYHKIDASLQLQDHDFDEGNSEYEFVLR
jgi:hypothetical protein